MKLGELLCKETSIWLAVVTVEGHSPIKTVRVSTVLYKAAVTFTNTSLEWDGRKSFSHSEALSYKFDGTIRRRYRRGCGAVVLTGCATGPRLYRPIRVQICTEGTITLGYTICKELSK